jgi:hypothetical protein
VGTFRIDLASDFEAAASWPCAAGVRSDLGDVGVNPLGSLSLRSQRRKTVGSSKNSKPIRARSLWS